VQPSQCPQCGAPATVQPGQATYECPYCKRTFQTAQMFGTPPPMANPMPQAPAFPPKQQQQHIVIVAPGGQYSPGDSVPQPRSGGSSGWGVMIGIAVLVLGVAGAIRFISHSASGGAGAALFSGLMWDGKDTLVCGGNDEITVTGVNANLTGTAIEAGGNCHVKIIDSTIKAGTVVDAAGNADVSFQGGSIDGTTAVDASGNAHVRFNNTKVTGPKKKSGNAKVD